MTGIYSTAAQPIWYEIATAMGYVSRIAMLTPGIVSIPEPLVNAAEECGITAMMDEMVLAGEVFEGAGVELLRRSDELSGYPTPGASPYMARRYGYISGERPQKTRFPSSTVSKLVPMKQYSHFSGAVLPGREGHAPIFSIYPTISDCEFVMPEGGWSVAIVKGDGISWKPAEALCDLMFLMGLVDKAYPKLLVLPQGKAEYLADDLKSDISQGIVRIVYDSTGKWGGGNATIMDYLEESDGFYRIKPDTPVSEELLDASACDIRRLEFSRAYTAARIPRDGFEKFLFSAQGEELVGGKLLDVISLGMSPRNPDTIPYGKFEGLAHAMDLRHLQLLYDTDYVKPGKWRAFAEELVDLSILWSLAWRGQRGAPHLQQEAGYALTAALGRELGVDIYLRAYYEGCQIEDLV